jgi:hypothetical protein
MYTFYDKTISTRKLPCENPLNTRTCTSIQKKDKQIKRYEERLTPPALNRDNDRMMNKTIYAASQHERNIIEVHL